MMIKGNRIHLRPLKQQDLDLWVENLNNFDYRGDYLPLNIANQVEINKKFSENGLWTEELGRLLIIENETNRMLGNIDYFKATHYMAGLEIGYNIFNPADRGKGYCSEALNMMTEWLFLSKQINRLQICADIENIGSRSVAEKCGYIYEGILRKAVYSRGKYRDLAIYSMTRADFENRQSEKSK